MKVRKIIKLFPLHGRVRVRIFDWEITMGSAQKPRGTSQNRVSVPVFRRIFACPLFLHFQSFGCLFYRPSSCSCVFPAAFDCLCHLKIKRDRKRYCGCLHCYGNLHKQDLVFQYLFSRTSLTHPLRHSYLQPWETLVQISPQRSMHRRNWKMTKHH